MRKQLLSFAVALFATGAMAQSVPTHDMYVNSGTPTNIVSALDKWEPGKPWNGDASFVDENFWISRVPLKNRFRPGDQANDALNDGNNKNFCWICQHIENYAFFFSMMNFFYTCRKFSFTTTINNMHFST